MNARLGIAAEAEIHRRLGGQGLNEHGDAVQSLLGLASDGIHARIIGIRPYGQ